MFGMVNPKHKTKKYVKTKFNKQGKDDNWYRIDNIGDLLVNLEINF